MHIISLLRTSVATMLTKENAAIEPLQLYIISNPKLISFINYCKTWTVCTS